MKALIRYRAQKKVASFLLAVLTGAFLMLPAVAAQAHDTLQSTDPANGSTVGAVPAQVGLNFDHTPLAIGSVVRVEDATGTDRADGAATIVDNHVTQAIKPGAPGGKYTVTWRVASADGHAIEGTFTFTAAPTPGGATPSVAPAGTTTSTGAVLPTGLIVAGIVALLLIIAFAALAVTAKRRLNHPET